MHSVPVPILGRDRDRYYNESTLDIQEHATIPETNLLTISAETEPALIVASFSSEVMISERGQKEKMTNRVLPTREKMRFEEMYRFGHW